MFSNPLCQVIHIYTYCIFGRIILSYFPISPGSVVAGVFSFLYTITEPVLGPVRRIIPPLGMGIDLSPLVVFLGIQIVSSTVLGC